MNDKSALILKVLLNKYHGGANKGALSRLSQGDVQKVIDQDTDTGQIEDLFQKPEQRLERIHYSWLQPAMNKFPKMLIPIVIASLPPAYRSKISPLMEVEPTKKLPAETVKNFLLEQLFLKLDNPLALPINFLPKGKLTPLLNLNKQQLIDVIDYLGLYDLAQEMRHIIDKQLLDGFYHCLNGGQRHFLSGCLQKKEKLKTTDLGLSNWNKDCHSLKRLLHLRGLGRLGYAICREHPDFVWYLTHTLDSGRGKLVQRHYKKKVSKGVCSVLTQEVINVMKFLKFLESR